MEIKLSTRAQKYLIKAFNGSLEDAVASVRSTETYPAAFHYPERTVRNGVKWGIEYPKIIKDSNGCWTGTGKKTALEIAAAIAAKNLASIEELFPNVRAYDRSHRIFFNRKALEFGYKGPLLPEEVSHRKHFTAEKRITLQIEIAKNKIQKNRDRIAKMENELARLELELSNLQPRS